MNKNLQQTIESGQAQPGDTLLMPVELRQAIMNFFSLPEVVAPTGAVIQIVQALSMLPIAPPVDGTEDGS